MLTIFLSLVIVFFVLLSAILGARLITLRNDLEEFSLRAALLEQGVKKALSNEANPIESTDGFVKFISDSRDWAFEYIEKVQLGINKFVSDIEPEINYFKEYGDLGSMAPNYYSMKKITESYEELKQLLPEEDK